MNRNEAETFDALLERLALPFAFAMALGVAVGRQLGSTLVWTVVFALASGALLFLAFAWLRLRLSDVPE